MIAPQKIKFRNKTNIDYDVIVDCAFESGDGGEVESYLNREAIVSETYDGSYTRNHGYKYNESLVATITFIKRNFEDFTPEENRRMLSWLTSARNSERLEVYHDDSEVVSYVLYGGFTTVQQRKMSNSRVVGYVCEFTNISPWAFSPTKIIEKQIEKPTDILIKCNTDDTERAVYPKITITFGDDYYIYIDNNPMELSYKMMENVLYSYEYDTWRKYSVVTNDDGTTVRGSYIGVVLGETAISYPDDGIVGDFWYTKSTTKTPKLHINISGTKATIEAVFANDVSQQTADETTNGKYYYNPFDHSVYKGTDGGWSHITTVSIGAEIQNVYMNEYDQDVNIRSTIIGCHEKEIITIDGANKIIASSDDPMRVIGNDFNWVWPYIMYGENKMTVIGNCDAKIEWTEPCKVGQL